MTNETDQEVPESAIDQIMGRAARLPGATELHAMIGSLSHQLSRAETALTELAAHARQREAEAAAHAHELYVRDTEKIQLNRRITELESLRDALTATLAALSLTSEEEAPTTAPSESAAPVDAPRDVPV